MVSLWKCFAILAFSFALPFAAHAKSEEVHYKKEVIEVGDKKITAEIAETEAQHEHGLMNRNSMKPDEGMLFIFADEEGRAFWMKNTFIDLSIGFFDASKNLVDIQEMKAVTSVMTTDLPTYKSAKPAKYALEMNKNWFAKNKIKVGAKLKLPNDSTKPSQSGH